MRLDEALRVYHDENYIDPMVKHLETQRRIYTANLGCDMGEDWFNQKGKAFRQSSLVMYVGMFLQATINRQFGMAARTVSGSLKLADETSGMTSLEPIQMFEKNEQEVTEVTREKLPAIFMERMREQAKERRDKARRISRGNPGRHGEPSARAADRGGITIIEESDGITAEELAALTRPLPVRCHQSLTK